LSLAKKNRLYYIHSLVLIAFDQERPYGFECRHLNGNRTDNRWPKDQEDLMIGWFANALMRGYDEAMSRMSKR
jgi:hypothetical protein